jgi:hypothetical protein
VGDWQPGELEDIEEFLTEADIEDMAETMEQKMRDLLSSWCFEVLLTLINPTPESREKIVTGLLRQSIKGIEAEINAEAKDIPRDEVEDFIKRVNAAANRAQTRFRRAFDTNPFDETFLERVRKSVRKNLSR